MKNVSQHHFNTVDFDWAGQTALFVKVSGFDAETGENFEGVVKFVGGRPYGDLVHNQRSFLSASCREELYAYLLKRYEKNEFS